MRGKTPPIRLAALVLFCVLAPAGFAWNKAGHMVSAAIAYQQLRHEHSSVLHDAVLLLQQHPDYSSVWRERLYPFAEDERALYLLMEAARWPDEIRRNQHYHRSEWHYINYPFKPDGQPRSLRVRDPERENILTALDHNKELLKDRRISNADRAIALCWVLHLVGDLHQPLHTSSYFTTEFPQGDRGGTLFQIRAAPDRAIINLHQFWDGLILGTERYQSAYNRALLVSAGFSPPHMPELANTRFRDWAKESFLIVQESVYLGGSLQGTVDNANVPVLTQSYRDQAKRIADRRIVLSGYRIANLLLDVFR